MDSSNFNYRQLTLAREYRGYSQSELSNAISGLSQPNLSKFEKGFGGLSEEIIEKLINFLDFPRSFFEEKISNAVESAHFRKRATITQKVRLSFDTNIKLIGFVIDKMSESVEFPDFNFSSFNVEDFSPEYIAEFTRRKLQIDPTKPISNIFRLLENNGIVIVEFDPKSELFDGVSFITDLGIPVIVINKRFPNDRKRFTLAHELGHLLMHILCEEPISIHRDREDEANKFASEFLMPKRSIYGSLNNLKLSDLGELKKYWLTSMSSIIRRAKDLGCISQDRYTYLNIELSRRGWKTNEPFEVSIDEPTIYQVAYKMHKEDLSYDQDDFIRGFSLPINVISALFEEKNKNNKLRLVI